ncbi:hypothetical protein ABIE00_002683 [Arthrobacter sp. OAP107]
MVAGADSIDDKALLRHSGMGRVFANAYSLRRWARSCGLSLSATSDSSTRSPRSSCCHWPSKHRSSRGLGPGGRAGDGRCRRHHHRGPRLCQAGRGLRVLRGPWLERAAGHGHHLRVRTGGRGPARKGSCGSPCGAKRPVADALKTVAAMTPAPPVTSATRLLVRADSAFYGADSVNAALRAGADVSVTVRLDKRVRAAIASIESYPGPRSSTDAVFDTDTWISRAEVAGVRVHLPQEGRAGDWPAGGPPDPGPQADQAARPRHPVRHGSTRSSPPTKLWLTPWPRTRPTAATRSSSRSMPTEELRAGAPALGELRGQLGVAGAGRDRVKPDPCRREPDRTGPGQGDHRDHPPQAHRRPGTHRHESHCICRPPGLGNNRGPSCSPGSADHHVSTPGSADHHVSATNHPAPAADRLALGTPLDRAVHQGVRTTTSTSDLTTEPATAQPRTPGRPGSKARQTTDPSPPKGRPQGRPLRQRSWVGRG